MDKDNDINIWPSYTDAVIGIFAVFLFFYIIFFSKNYFDLQRLVHLEEIVGKVEQDIEKFQHLFKEEKIQVEEDNEIKIILGEKSNVIFPIDSSSISSINKSGRDRILDIGKRLKHFLDEGEKRFFGIVIEGYTDRSYTDEHNYILSYNRAKNIMEYWIDECELNPNKYDIIPVGFGELESKLKEWTGNGVSYSENRRIEIRLIPKFGDLFRGIENINAGKFR